MKFGILGPIELWVGGRRLPVGGPRQVALLAFFLLHANRAVSNDQLHEALWDRQEPDCTSKRVQMAIARLRKSLEPLERQAKGEALLRTVSGGYLLTVAAGELDADAFQDRVAEGRALSAAGDCAGASEVLGAALELWRGPALAEVAYAEFAQSEIRRLEELRLGALESRIASDLLLGRHASVIGELEALCVEHPERERLAGQLMAALYRCERQVEALEVYSRTRIYLSEALGLEPGPALKTLQQQVLEQAPALGVLSDPRVSRRRQPLPRALQPAVGQLPFTGRQRELACLADMWAETGSRARDVLVISGEAGIGKTRAAAELAVRVHDAGATVLYGGCDEGLAVPYQPFIEVLRGLLPTLDGDDLRSRLGGLAPELGRLLPELADVGSPISTDPESARFALFEAVVALLEFATERQRTLLVIDDVHWAAPATLLLLRHLIRSERPLALLVIFTFRSTELQPDTPLAQLLADLQRDTDLRRIPLGGLDEQAIETLLRAAIGSALTDRMPQLVAMVHAQTAGNPFFVRELIAHMLESRALTGTGGDCDPAMLPPRLDVPEGLRSVICQRVARLSEAARRLMQIASVAGSAVSLRLVQHLLAEHIDLLDALDETVSAGLLVDSGRGELAFAHALVRQAVYESLSTARRLDLHRQLGEALESEGDTQGHADALAHHFAQLVPQGETDKAVTYATAAGHAATARLAYEDAAAHFKRGLDVLAQAQAPDAARHLELLLGLGQTHWSTGEADKARDAFWQAAEIAHRTADAGAAAAAALGFSGPLFFEVGAALTGPNQVLLERALEMLGEQHSAQRARLMGRLAATLTYGAGHHDHRGLAHDALTMARRAGDKHALADVLATSYWATRGPEDPDHHLRMARELTLLAEEVDDVRLLTYGRGWVMGHLLERGDIDGAKREYDDLEGLVKTRNDSYARWLLSAHHAMFAILAGELARAESLALDAVAQWDDRPPFAAPQQVLGIQLNMVRQQQGRLDELVELVAIYVEQTPTVSAWRCSLASMYAHLGDRDRAARELELIGDPSDLAPDALWLSSITLIAYTTCLIDDVSRSQQAYELLLPHANTCVVLLAILCEGSASRLLGMLATTIGRYDEAEQHFERALEMNERIRSPLWTAHTQFEYARMLGLRCGDGDPDRATTLLMTAIATADELGLDTLHDRATTQMVHGGGCV